MPQHSSKVSSIGNTQKHGVLGRISLCSNDEDDDDDGASFKLWIPLPQKRNYFCRRRGSKYETWRNWVAVNTSSCMFLIIKIVGSFFGTSYERNTIKLRVHHHSGTILHFEELDAPPSPPPRAYTQQILRWNGYPSFSLMFDPWVREWRKPDKLCTLLKGLAYNQDSAFYAALNIHDELTLHRFPEQQHSHRQGAASP